MSEMITGWAQNIPMSYKRKAREQGKLEIIEYETIDYTRNLQTAILAIAVIRQIPFKRLPCPRSQVPAGKDNPSHTPAG